MSAAVPTAKRFHAGTHRVLPPEETWDRVRPLLPRAGITRVADVTALDRLGIPVYQAVRPASRNLSVSQGKGATPEAARVSAAMEALELWHAEDLGALPQAEMSLKEMRSAANPIPLASLRWSSAAPVADGAPIPWVRARAWGTDRLGWLPRAMLELDFRLPLGLGVRPFNISSNGLASGNCLEEAVLHAVCELAERHALFLEHREPWRKVPVDLDSVEPPGCREMIARFRDAGMKLAVHDLTWEAGIPVLAADFAAPDIANLWRGSGCHPSPEVALSRALTEAAQSRLTFIAGARDDIPELDAGPGAHQTFDGFAEPRGGRRFAELPDLATDSVAADLDRVVERLERSGLPTFFVDLTREEMGVPVAMAFVPGLRELSHGHGR